MSLSVAKTHEWIGNMIASGHKVEIAKNVELSSMSGNFWQNVYVDGKFYCNIVDDELALGTIIEPVKDAA